MDNDNKTNGSINAPPESDETSNTEAVTDLTEVSADNTESIVDLTEVSTESEASSAEASATDEEKSETAAEADSAPEKDDEKSVENSKAASSAAMKKYRFDILGRIIIWVVTVSVFLSVFLITGYYVTTASKGEFHADCTDTIMWANASAESGHLYDKEFKYACFLPIGTSNIMRPLLHFYGLSMKTHIIGMTCFFVLLTLFMILMMREVTKSLPASLTGTSIFLALTLSTPKMREIFWGHTIYYSLGIFFLVVGTFMYFRIMSLDSNVRAMKKKEKKNRSRIIWKIMIFILLCAFMLLTGMDGVTGLTLFTIPFTGAVFAEHFINSKQKILSCKSTVVLFRVVTFIVMAVIGVLINNKCVGKLVASYQDANTEFSGMDSWIDHLHDLPIAWMKLLGVQNIPDVMFTDEKGIYNIIYIMTSLIIAVIPIIATCCYKKYGRDRKGRMMRIWIWIHWAVTAVILMGYIFGILAAAEWRIIPMIGTAIIVSILFVFWSVSTGADTAKISVLLMIPVMAGCILSCSTVTAMDKDGYKKNTQFMLADFLKSEGVTRGYSTFWNANSITVITGEEIKVSDVFVDEGGVRMRHYQSSNRWYKDIPSQNEYFLLVGSDELTKLSSSDFFTSQSPVRQSETVINGATYSLFVFDHNIV